MASRAGGVLAFPTPDEVALEVLRKLAVVKTSADTPFGKVRSVSATASTGAIGTVQGSGIVEHLESMLLDSLAHRCLLSGIRFDSEGLRPGSSCF
jgi:hypothetical protein